jgi:hypothetical protein
MNKNIGEDLKKHIAKCRGLINKAKSGGFAKPKWSNDEIDILQKLFKNRTIDQVADELGQLGVDFNASNPVDMDQGQKLEDVLNDSYEIAEDNAPAKRPTQPGTNDNKQNLSERIDSLLARADKVETDLNGEASMPRITQDLESMDLSEKLDLLLSQTDKLAEELNLDE